jgi:putative thioredoxin
MWASGYGCWRQAYWIISTPPAHGPLIKVVGKTMALLSGLMGKSEPAAGGGGGDWIKDSDTQGFMEDVIQASREVPVLVDFWAPWCGPCKQLTPVLEKVVNAAAGAVRLVKINIDENQALAQQLRIQSVPMVYAFKNGQPADGFSGALPESQIKAFIERIAGPIGPGAAEVGVEQAREALSVGQVDLALDIFQQVLADDPSNVEALAGAARAEIALNRATAARDRLESVPKEHENHVEIAGAKAALSLAEEAGTLPDPNELVARLQADEGDHGARLDFATAMFLRGQTDEAMGELLQVVKADRDWQDQAARKQLLKFFDALGPNHPATVAGRRQLSAVLFS